MLSAYKKHEIDARIFALLTGGGGVNDVDCLSRVAKKVLISLYNIRQVFVLPFIIILLRY